jgi:hypothetical protein
VVVKFLLRNNYLRGSEAGHAIELVIEYDFTSVCKTGGAGKIAFSSSSPIEYLLE